jgi:tetratricopeptide (TPR) repeat protein
VPEPLRVPDAHAAVAEIERRIRWRTMSIVVFLGILVVLAVVAAVPVLSPPRMLSGLPRDPDAIEASRRVRDHVRIDSDGLRFASALLGGEAGQRSGPIDAERIAAAQSLLDRARARRSDDPRLIAASACLDLALEKIRRAEAEYRQALSIEDRFGEAHLGLGLVLARRAMAERDATTARGLTLEAIAQLAAVPERDPYYTAALYDRVVLLDRVGRKEEARHHAHDYLRRDSTSSWAESLRLTAGIAR